MWTSSPINRPSSLGEHLTFKPQLWPLLHPRVCSIWLLHLWVKVISIVCFYFLDYPIDSRFHLKVFSVIMSLRVLYILYLTSNTYVYLHQVHKYFRSLKKNLYRAENGNLAQNSLERCSSPVPCFHLFYITGQGRLLPYPRLIQTQAFALTGK